MCVIIMCVIMMVSGMLFDIAYMPVIRMVTNTVSCK